MPNQAPPYTGADRALIELRDSGYVVLAPDALTEITGANIAQLEALRPAWDRLPLDEHLLDGGRYRRRRHGSFVVEGDRLTAVAHRAHWQPEEYNALHGGMQRWFEPLEPGFRSEPVWTQLMLGIARLLFRAEPTPRWFIEAHPFRIDTAAGIGRPTPEGAHRDGVDFVALILIGRHAIKGGETRVFDADGPKGQRFTLSEPWSMLLLDDRRVIHESTPIQQENAQRSPGLKSTQSQQGDPAQDSVDRAGHRDTLVLTFRSAGFQDPSDGD